MWRSRLREGGREGEQRVQEEEEEINRRENGASLA